MKRRKQMRYPFIFTFQTPDGKPQQLTLPVPMRYATHPVALTLDKPHVLESKRLHGSGNTQTCSVAICGCQHKHAFKHPVYLIDFTAARAAVATRPAKRTGIPVDCIMYRHSRADIADINDMKDGHDRLLEMIDRDGPITINLYPIKSRRRSTKVRARARARAIPKVKKPPSGRHVRAKRRFAIAQLGMTP